MWRQEDYIDFPNIRDVKRYYVQNLFGAYENMVDIGIKNVMAVPAIINVDYQDKHENNRINNAIHLGGLLNPINSNTTKIYLNGIIDIIHLVGLQQPNLLLSESARSIHHEILHDIHCMSLRHQDAINFLGNARQIWTSPGLTTLLELSKLNLKILPLPPQNYSQVLIIRNITREFGQELPTIWHFLNHEYSSIKAGLPEIEGVQATTDINSLKLSDATFLKNYAELARDKAQYCVPFHNKWVIRENGSYMIANDMKLLLT